MSLTDQNPKSVGLFDSEVASRWPSTITAPPGDRDVVTTVRSVLYDRLTAMGLHNSRSWNAASPSALAEDESLTQSAPHQPYAVDNRRCITSY